MGPFVGFLLTTCAAVFDLRTREIPDWVPIAMGLVALLACSLTLDEIAWLDRAVGLGAGFGVGALLFYAGVFGGGDAKLLAGIGAVAGWHPLLSIAFYTALFGGALGFVAMRRGQADLAYAPAMACGFGLWLLLRTVAPQAPGMWGSA